MLVGRRDETAELDRLLGDVREGRSAVVVLRGDAGVGKTALLEYAVASATGFHVARADGVESEAELPFAALQHLCGPMLDALGALPDPQRDALGAAFGMSEARAPERFLVGLAALSLLSAAAQEEPMLCVIDDAQWLDPPSAQAIAFVARRLLADPVAIMFATRDRSDQLEGLPEMVLEGLGTDDARALLAATLDEAINDRVRDRIVEETGGNPLALLELPHGTPSAELVVGPGSPAGQETLSGKLEERFRRRAEELPFDTRQLMLVAAADQQGDPDEVRRAADLLSIDMAAAGPADEAGLLTIEDRVRFRHPLVRSAIYRGASREERRVVHGAHAEATDRESDPDRYAWHRAAAAVGPDENVAAALELSAGRAQGRGGITAAAAFLERSAELTPDLEKRSVRLLLAAGAHLMAGSNKRAQQLLEESTPGLADTATRAQASRLAGAIRFADGRGADTPGLLFDAAMAFRDIDVGLARETLMECLESAYWAEGLTSGTTVFDVAEAARRTPGPDDDDSVPNLLLNGYTERLTGSYADAVGWWRRAARAHLKGTTAQPQLKWEGMAWNATGELLDFEAHIAIAREWVRVAREQGALTTLAVAISGLAFNETQSGRMGVATALIAEAREIAAATGLPAVPGSQDILELATRAWQGKEETREVAAEVTREAIARGQGLGFSIANQCLAILELGHGRYEEARINGLNVFERDPLYIGSMGLADLVEAAVRSDDIDAAEMALDRLADRAEASGTPWGLGLLARARALLASDDSAEALYVESIDHLGRSGVGTELGRSHLLYGEWLRRRRRRRDARRQLRVAHDMLDAMELSAFAHRAGVELLATGERARSRVAETRDDLTPQEGQIAGLAADGNSNSEIAAQLFISPHTVAYHLRKVFSKLGVTSRNQLGDALGIKRGTEPTAS